MVKPSHRKLMATEAISDHGLSVVRACRLFCISKVTYSYTSKLSDDNQMIAELLLKITNEHKTW